MLHWHIKSFLCFDFLKITAYTKTKGIQSVNMQQESDVKLGQPTDNKREKSNNENLGNVVIVQNQKVAAEFVKHPHGAATRCYNTTMTEMFLPFKHFPIKRFHVTISSTSGPIFTVLICWLRRSALFRLTSFKKNITAGQIHNAETRSTNIHQLLLQNPHFHLLFHFNKLPQPLKRTCQGVACEKCNLVRFLTTKKTNKVNNHMRQFIKHKKWQEKVQYSTKRQSKP